jgi:uncharacterized protein
MGQSTKSLLIIFYRNPTIGQVKTRLAVTIGKEKALEVFRRLASHTKQITESLTIDKIVFYSDSIDLMDIWPNAKYLKALQQGNDLGEKMKNSFAAAFESGYDSVCIIGTDCYELETRIIAQAFEALVSDDVVIGPASDGGYYLLGMRRFHPELFDDKQWSTETVFERTVSDIQSLGLKYSKLRRLRDVDTEGDLPEEWRQI